MRLLASNFRLNLGWIKQSTAMPDRENCDTGGFQAIDDPIDSVMDFADVRALHVGEDLPCFREMTEYGDPLEKAGDPSFGCLRTIGGDVGRDLRGPSDRQRGPDDSHFVRRARTRRFAVAEVTPRPWAI